VNDTSFVCVSVWLEVAEKWRKIDENDISSTIQLLI